MSELINNREYRREELKEIIRALHQGASVEDVKARFKALTDSIGSTEIAAMEQELMREGIPIDEIRRLCDVHAAIFEGAVKPPVHAGDTPGHPAHTFRRENEALSKVIKDLRPVLEQLKTASGDQRRRLMDQWQVFHSHLRESEKHYLRKENLLFPYLEKYEITGPPKVMWRLHDEVRARLKQITPFLERARGGEINDAELRAVIDDLALPALRDMEMLIKKEDEILWAMSLETLSEDDWVRIQEQSGQFGYTLIEPGVEWKPVRDREKMAHAQPAPPGLIEFGAGALSRQEVELIFNHLPVDITFVDRDGIVRYFSQGKDRIFARTPAIIGRKVQNCHPPSSVHVVEKIIEDFRERKRDEASFWLTLGGKFVYIRYFAVRDGEGNFEGVVEVTQDVTGIRELKGEKRLLDDAPVGTKEK